MRPLYWLALVLAGCAASSARSRVYVAATAPLVAPPTAGADSGLALAYDARLCSVELRGPGGARTWTPPDSPWEVQSSAAGATLVALIPLPPGAYTLAAYTAVEGFTEGVSRTGRAMGYTDCAHRRATRHVAGAAVEIPAGGVGLAALPAGAPDFHLGDRFTWSRASLDARYPGWYSRIHDAGRAAHDALVASLRQRRDGYDVYPGCNGATAVVRATGTPFSYLATMDDAAARARFRGEALAGIGAVPSQHANGFGGACLGPAFMIAISDPRQLDAAVRAAGEWLVRADLRGEVDILVEGVPTLF